MITFTLKHADVKSKDETLIYLTYYFNGKRMKMSTGEKILPRNWNKEKCRPRANAPSADTLTVYLDRLESKVKETHLALKSEFTQVTPDVLRRAMSSGQRGQESFVKFFARFIEESTPHRPPGSMEVYRSAYKLLSGYVGAKEFEDIAPQWFVRYQGYMERHGYSANYIGKNVAIIREVITIAKKQGLTKNDTYRDPDYRKPSEEVQTIYLSEYELLKIYGIELPDYLDRVRNRFLIGAYSGLRFSDSAKITPQSIRDNLLFDRNIKTGANVVIPIHWVIEQIMADHPDGLPPSISNQKTNRYLKEIGKRAGIDEQVTVSKTKGGRVVSVSCPKYEMITTHTARRSAATNMYKAGIPSISIMKITGHKTESSFMKYIRISKEENAKLIQSHSFFQSH